MKQPKAKRSLSFPLGWSGGLKNKIRVLKSQATLELIDLNGIEVYPHNCLDKYESSTDLLRDICLIDLINPEDISSYTQPVHNSWWGYCRFNIFKGIWRHEPPQLLSRFIWYGDMRKISKKIMKHLKKELREHNIWMLIKWKARTIL